MTRGLEKVAADRRHLVAGQVRCSTGFTQGRVVDGQPMLVASAPSAVRGGARVAGDRAMAVVHAARADLMLAWLRALPEGAALPGLAEMAEAAGLEEGNRVARDVAWRALETLQRRGAILKRGGSAGRRGHERAVWLRAEGRGFATPDAPPEWLAALRDEAARGAHG